MKQAARTAPAWPGEARGVKNRAIKPAAALAWSVLILIAVEIAPAQESASHKLRAPVLNSGGQPLNGSTAVSAGFRMRADAIGESAVSSFGASPSYTLGAGFLQSFPAPGEVDNLRLPDTMTLAWDPEPLADRYRLYRAGPMGSPMGVAPMGACLQSGISGTGTTDPVLPAPGRAYFYFVNAVNVMGVEGPDGAIGVPCH